MKDQSEASIEKTDLIKSDNYSMHGKYVVRAVNGSIIEITDSLDEAISTAVQFREMKLALGETEAHCNVEQKIVVYSTMNSDKPQEIKSNLFRNF